MHFLIGGGTGFIGQFMIARYLEAGHQVSVVSRSLENITRIFENKVTAYDWNTIRDMGCQSCQAIDCVINLAGAGIADKRWTPARKQTLIDSRIDTTALLSKYCAELGDDSPPLFIAGGVGIYGAQKPVETGLPPALDETTPLADHPTDTLSKIGRLWEAASQPAKDQGVRVINLRFGVVFGQKGGALQQMIRPFQIFLGGKMGTGQQPVSWVSIVDLCRAIDFILEKTGISGPVNIVAPKCITQNELAESIGEALHRPTVVSTPDFVLKFMLGEMADELLLNGQHVTPQVLISNGFKFQHPDIKTALSYALQVK